MATAPATTQIQPAAGIRFTVASRPQRRFSATQTVSNLNGATSFQPISLPATGFVRKISMFFTVACTSASAGAIVAGDGPWNLVQNITLSDATGQPIVQPLGGYSTFLKNKYFGTGTDTQAYGPYNNPQMGPEFAFASTATQGTATFRLDLDLEQSAATGYGCIPNLDANASLQLKIDVGAITNAFAGTTMSAATVSVRVTQHYWAPIGATLGGIPVSTTPSGFGDFVECRYELQNVAAQAEGTIAVTNRGGLVKGIIAVSRAAGVRTAFTSSSNVGLVYDNNAIDEGVLLSEHQDMMRRTYGYVGADITTSYAPLAAGVLAGIDTGVLVWPFFTYSGDDNRDSWLSTRVGTLLQLKVTPGASATQLELITELGQIKDAASFYEHY